MIDFRVNEWMSEWVNGESSFWGGGRNGSPPPPLKPVSPSIAICSLTRLGAKRTVRFSALRVSSELHFQGPRGAAPVSFRLLPCIFTLISYFGSPWPIPQGGFPMG
ncbi:unnamed protein product [Rangifer tarandus platyrhynchus]|uniref:Uncharacterized protein n=1 Tax=Rangifer tarandus platyrhynchus TaxID=3082113 RepID=A0AC59YA99_RANTA